MNNKRLIICTIGGLLAGIICYSIAFLFGWIREFSFLEFVSILFNRLMIGFIIGISQIKINYLLHGILIGFLVSFINSISSLGNDVTGFLLYTIAGIIYGFLIELFATKVFKAGIV